MGAVIAATAWPPDLDRAARVSNPSTGTASAVASHRLFRVIVTLP
jgi:hypothetical protein